jgi:hypothetical protein
MGAKLFSRKCIMKILRFRRRVNALWISSVKFISVLFAITLTLHAAPSDPGKVAIDFLEKVRLRKLDLEPGGDTALSAQTAEGKKLQIARRLERMAHDLGSDPLEVGQVKMDENFAAVLVRKIGGFDPSRLQVFPVALVKRGAEWMVAPVPASFENAGTGYALALRKRLDILENWMLQEQVVDLEKLREASAANMRRKIEASLSAGDLRAFSAKQVAERLVTACGKGDLPSLLGLLGGLSANLPDDWAARLKSADRAMAAGPAAPRPWRLLTAPEVLRVLVQDGSDNDSHLITIDCLDPAGIGSKAPRVEFVQFELAKQTDGLWQINPPQAFLEDSDDAAEEPDEESDEDLLDAFPEKWSELHPPAPHPTAELAYQTLIKNLQNGSLPTLLTLSKLDKNPQTARKTCIQAAQIWWAVSNPSTVFQAIPLAFTADESTGAGLFQFFSARDPDKFDARVLYFEKTPTGWLWAPTPTNNISDEFKTWVNAETKRWTDQWQQPLLAESILLTKLDDMKAPTESDARKCLHAWLDATRCGDLKSALRLTARLGDPQSNSIALRNVAYEIKDSRRSEYSSSVTAYYQGKTWAAVGVKTVHGGKSNYPLYPVIQTADGPRIVIEIDLIATGNRGRDFLNRAAFERLQEASSAAVTDELQSLYAAHQAHLESLGVKSAR